MDRNPRADWLKAAAIFGVVFIHAPGPPGDYTTAFRYCVPVFVALWAYYFDQGLTRRAGVERGRYVRSRFVRLFVPYIVWTVIYLPVYYPLAALPDIPLRSLIADAVAGDGWAGQFFFIILFQLLFVVALVSRFVGRAVVWASLLAGLVGYPLALAFWDVPAVSIFRERLFVYWWPYAALGVGLARGYLPRIPIGLALPVAVVALVGAPFEFQFVTARVPQAPAYLLVSVYIGSVALAWAALWGSPPSDGPGNQSGLGRASGYVGQHTFPVYLTNPLLVGLFAAALPADLLAPPGGYAVRAVVTLAAIGGGLVIGWAFRRFGMGKLVGE